MAQRPPAAMRPALVAVAPVLVLAALSTVAVVAAAPVHRVLALSCIALGTVLAVGLGLVLARSLGRQLEGLAAAAVAADRALDDAARALARGRASGPQRDRGGIEAGGERPAKVGGSARTPAGATSGPAAAQASPDLARALSAASATSAASAVAVTTATLDRLVATSTQLLDDEARRRRRTADLFVNVGRRNQNLVGRQLKLLDRLEESETDPDTLAALFRLDHLSTRMRRNAESLLVVAGLDPPRRWRQPVPVREVARAAAAESEQFERVELGVFPVVALEGDAVGTVVHLVAELVDNAVRFSPPDTSVVLSARLDGDDLVLAVVDSGVGMASDTIEQVNTQLACGDDADDIPAAHLGLYVVGRLAGRLGIVVRLDSTAGDGVTASVRVPARLVEAAPTSAVAAPAPAEARRAVAIAERAGNGTSTARRAKAAPERRAANGGHRAEARPAPMDTPTPAAPAAAAGATDLGAGRGANGTGRTVNGFRRRQPKPTSGVERDAGRAPSRLRTPDAASAEERRDRLQRFSAGKATAEEIMTLGDPDDVAALEAELDRNGGDGDRSGDGGDPQR